MLPRARMGAMDSILLNLVWLALTLALNVLIIPTVLHVLLIRPTLTLQPTHVCNSVLLGTSETV